MVNAVSPWRALRPVLLAGAATLTWLTFSSPAASADVLSDTSSLLGGVTSSVSSVTDRLAGPALTVPAPPPPATPPVGLLQPFVGQVSGIADNIVSVVPVVNQVVPAGTVTAVAAPIAYVADGATAAVVEAVVPPVAGSLPGLEPVLQPVSDLVTGTAPLPVELPELPVRAVHEDAPVPGAVAPTEAAAEPAPADTSALSGWSLTAAPDTATFPYGSVALAGTSATLWVAASVSDFSDEQPSTADPSPAPAQAPAAPGSGAGSGAASGGSPRFGCIPEPLQL
ncbi:hypothetical protein [Arthrobacter sp. W4I7]|uniref:hypothetical protein n=1 Tax=Arthrobacter sp. W4I7 TaxID=3042296 RepID=UPI002780E7C5|nr:hypothetical protein [Arthrobacter sp. W4I7]MDQ0692030.1 hypothetical protein [Arthrobacter sp. W4I7]